MKWAIRVLMVLFLVFAADGGSKAWSQGAPQLVFLRGGDVWITDPYGKSIRRVTHGLGVAVICEVLDVGRLLLGDAATSFELDVPTGRISPVSEEWEVPPNNVYVQMALRTNWFLNAAISPKWRFIAGWDAKNSVVLVLPVWRTEKGWSVEVPTVEAEGIEWSPDAAYIALACHATHGGDGVMVIDCKNRTVRRITKWGSNHAWAPGPRHWLATIEFTSITIETDTYGPIFDGRLLLYDADTQRTDVLCRIFTTLPSQFEWSPDGRMISVLSCERVNTSPVSVMLVDAISRSVSTLCQGRYVELAWSGDGRYLALTNAASIGPRGAGSKPCTVEIWRVADRRKIASIPDGCWIAWTDNPGPVRHPRTCEP